MTRRQILKMGDARLLRKAKLVPPELIGSDKLKQLIADMFDTMTVADGIGLAAPQIGVDLQIVIFGLDNTLYPERPFVPTTVLLNPVIAPLSTEQEDGWEGCLSLPGMRGLVPRFKHIRYEGIDPEGGAIVREVSDFHARMVQHECDHLFGFLYPMRMKDLSHFGFSDAMSFEPTDVSDDGLVE